MADSRGPGWEFAALGPVEVRRGGATIRLRPKGRDLLALLLTRANQPVRSDRLIEELWKGDPPPSAEKALRVHVSHLREAFGAVDGSAESPVRFERVGYQLVVEDGAFDVDRFEAGVRDGRTALTTGAPREAVDLIGGALRLWHGPAYHGVESLEPVQNEVVRLAELRLDAIELLADAHLAIDQPGWVCELLAPEVRDHPMRETLVERLMLALYRSGRSVDALRVCSRLREVLDDELGVAPGAAIRALEQRIVVQDPALDVPRERTTPRSSVARKSIPFVGRRVEARELDQQWEAASGGESRVAVIAGAAGIGKTALADQLVQRASREGATVLVGHCDPDPVADYQPFPHLVRQAVLAAPDGVLEQPILGELGRLVPELADRLPPVAEPAEPAEGQRRLFAAVGTLLDACAGPVLLVVEDLHWADRGALALLRAVTREHDGPLLAVVTYREEEAGPDTPLGAALATGDLAAPDLRIELDGLSVAELKALLDVLAPERDRPIDLAQLSDLTGGNPLFVREVVRALADAPDEVPLAELAPEGIRTLVGHQLQRLSPEARDVLLVASVLGSEFSLTLLATVGRMAETTVLDALEEALATRLVTETEALDLFTFSHPLVRNIISTSMPASRRARLHLRAGEILAVSTTDGRWAEPARHFLAAAPLGDPAQTARFARRAGDDASHRFAHDDAAAWYRAALAAGADGKVGDDEQGETMLALGLAIERGGDRDAAREIYLDAAELAESTGNASLLADVAIAAAPRYVTIDAFHPVQRALVDRALAMPQDDLRLVRLFNCASASRYYDEGEADTPYAERAIELAARTSDPRARAIGMAAYIRWLTHEPGAAEERARRCRELRRVCEEASNPEFVGSSTRDLLANLLCLGRFDEFDEELTRLDEICATLDVPADRYWARAVRATRSLMTDPPAHAEGMVRAARTLGRSLGQTDAEGTFILQMFALRCQQGRSREIASGLEAPSDTQPRMLAGLSLLARALVEGGRPADARRVVDHVLRGGIVRFPRDNMRFAATALIGGVAAAVGSDAQRELCRAELEPFAEQWCVFGAGGAVFGTGHHWVGELAVALGDRDRARDHLTRARRASELAGSPYWTDRAQAALDRLEGGELDPHRVVDAPRSATGSTRNA